MSLIPTTALPETPTTTTSPTLSPTSSPTGVTTQSPLPDKLSSAANAAPGLSPSATVGIATTSNTTIQAAENAYFANNYNKASQIVDQLKTLSPAEQSKIWNAASDSSKAILAAAQYRPPEFTPHPQSGWWHDALSVGDFTKHMVYHAADTVLNDSPLTKAWQVGGNLVNHVLGTVDTMGQQNALAAGSGTSPSAWLNMLNVNHFISAWHETTNASMSYQPEVIQYIKQSMGISGQLLQFAKVVASGKNLQQVLASVPAIQRGQAYALIQSSPKFIDAVKLLSDSHVTFGQAVFGGLNPAQAKTVLPGASTLGLDTLSVLGQAGAVAASTYMAGTGDEAGVASETAPLIDEAHPLLSRVGSALGNVKRTTLLTGAGLQSAASLKGALTGQTADQAGTISPFGSPVHVASGIADGVVGWYLNPLQMGFEVRTAVRAEQAAMISRAMGNAQEVEAIYRNSSQYNRSANQIATLLTTPFRESSATSELNAEASGLASTPNTGLLMTRMGLDTTGVMPLIREHYADIKAAVEGGDSAEIGAAVGRMLGEGTAMTNVAQGKMSFTFREASQLPKLTLADDVLDRIRGLGVATMNGERFNMAKLGFRGAMQRLVGEQQARAVEQLDAANPKLGVASRMMRRAGSLTPVGSIDVADPHALTNLDRTLSFALSPARRADILSVYQNAATQGQRILIARAGVLEMLRVAWGWSDEAQARLQEWESRQHYGAPGSTALWVNPLDPEGPRMEMAILPSQLSTQVGAPRFSEVYHSSQKSWLMQGVEGGLNNRAVDMFMSRLWKPFMLLRLGFGIRVAGEELASFMLRNGGWAYLKARVAASLTDAFSVHAAEKIARADLIQRAAMGEESAQDILNSQKILGAMTSHIPQGALTGLETAKELIGKIYGWHTVQWFQRAVDRAKENGLDAARAVGQGIVGQDMLESAQLYADAGYLDQGFAEHASAAGGHSDSYLGENANVHDRALLKSENGVPMTLVRDGVFKSRLSDDPKFLDEYHKALETLTDDSWARIAMRAHAHGGYNGQVQAVEDALRGRKLYNDLAIAQQDGLAEADAAEKRVLAAHPQLRSGQYADGKTLEEHLAADYKLGKAKGNVDALVAKIDAHNALLSRFPTAVQTEDGHLVAGNAERTDQMIRDWARAIVDHVNSKVMTLHVQELHKEKMLAAMAPEDVAAYTAGHLDLPTEHANPQPIMLDRGRAPSEPYRVEVHAGKPGDPKTYDVQETFPDSAYQAIPDSAVRLFTPVAEGDGAGYNPAKNPGRFWTPSFNRASALAGDEGKVYQIDVPRNVLADEFITHGGEPADIVKSSYEAQHPALGVPIDPRHGAHFESGTIRYAQITRNTPTSLMDVLGRGLGVPSTSMLRKIEPEALPPEIFTPDMALKAGPGGWEKMIGKSFYQMVGRPVDWISRQPQYLYEAHLGRMEEDARLARLGIADPGHELALQVGNERAMRETTRYIHNPEMRSQMSVIGRGMAPFWFAQEQFYKRWGHLFGNYPEAFYKLSYTMTGLRSVGFIYTDQYGQAAFMVPGSAATMNLLSHLPVFNQFFNEPTGAGFSMEVSSLNPSLTNGMKPVPSAGPVLSIPALVAGWMSPRLSPFSQFLQGPNAAPISQAQGRAWRLLDQVLPTIFARGAAWANVEGTSSPASSAGPAIYLSTMVMAAQQLEVAGHGITRADQLNPIKMQQYANRLSNYTENLILARTLFGFVAPGTPDFAFNNQSLGGQLQALLSETNGTTFTFQDAITAFIKANPGAAADTIFATTTASPSESGTYVPATQLAGEWLKQNSSFVNAFPQAAMYAIPPDAAKGAFDQATYQAEMDAGLRSRRPLFDPSNPGSWYVDYEYSKAANVYYTLEQYVYAAGGAPTANDATLAQAQLGMTQEQAAAYIGHSGYSGAQIKQVWDQYKQGFMKANPIFAQQQVAMGARSAARRANVVAQLQQAIHTGNLPEGTWGTDVAELMGVFNQVQDFYSKTQGNSSYDTQRATMKQDMMVFGTQFVLSHPQLSTLWTSVLSKQIGVIG